MKKICMLPSLHTCTDLWRVIKIYGGEKDVCQLRHTLKVFVYYSYYWILVVFLKKDKGKLFLCVSWKVGVKSLNVVTQQFRLPRGCYMEKRKFPINEELNMFLIKFIGCIFQVLVGKCYMKFTRGRRCNLERYSIERFWLTYFSTNLFNMSTSSF